MASGPCPFCRHANPAAAKFCNECGAVLQLKPCERCDAINDRDATSCHQCGSDFTDAAPLTADIAEARSRGAGAEGEVVSTVARALETVEADLASVQHPTTVRGQSSSTARRDSSWRELFTATRAAREFQTAPRRSFDGVPRQNGGLGKGDRKNLEVEVPTRSRRRAIVAAALLVTAFGAVILTYQRTPHPGASLTAFSSGSIDQAASAPGAWPQAPSEATTTRGEVVAATAAAAEAASPGNSDDPAAAATQPGVVLAQPAVVPAQPVVISAEPAVARARPVAVTKVPAGTDDSRQRANAVDPGKSTTRRVKKPAPKYTGDRETVRLLVGSAAPAAAFDPLPSAIPAARCMPGVAALGLCMRQDVSDGH